MTEMKIGDLVRKRWGRIDPYQVGTVGVCLGRPNYGDFKEFIMVAYSGKKPSAFRLIEFEVISEAR
jgi:hypothetical protein